MSAIILNHNMDVVNNDVTYEWKTKLNIDNSLKDEELAISIRDQVGEMGWLPPWTFHRDNSSFNFKIMHLGKEVLVNTNLITGETKFAEAPKGFVAVFHGLHFFNGKIPNAPWFIKTWAAYQWLSLFIMFISLILGLWLWLKYSYKPWQGVVFGGLFIGTILIMILI